MAPRPAWFTVIVKDLPGALRIRGEATGGRNWDDAHPYDVHVEAAGLRIDTEKLFDPGQIEAFVQRFGALAGVGGGQPVTLRSAMAADFDLSILAKDGMCRLTFRLRHGHADQWSVEFTVGADLSAVQVESGG
jgi:hypothetical protein